MHWEGRRRGDNSTSPCWPLKQSLGEAAELSSLETSSQLPASQNHLAMAWRV